jgi:divalent metal cation (Fe/Co/Zn/Cd) transporter
MNLTVLAISGILEAVSLRRSRRETRSRATLWQVSETEFVRATSDTPLRAVVVEDVVALLGVALAAIGLSLSAVTGSAAWDALSSVAVGLLLLVAAVVLAGRNVSLLVGRSAPQPINAAIGQRLSAISGISRIAGLYTEATGPGRYLVLARVDFDDALSAAAVEAVARTAEMDIRADFPIVDAVYVHPAAAG